MKLLAHNFLSSQFLKNVKEGYPLILRATSVKKQEFEFNENMIAKMLPKIDYPVLINTAKSIGIETNLPSELPNDAATNTELLQMIAELVMSVDVVEGELECPESGRIFPIHEGIPNLLVNEEQESKWVLS